MTPEKQQIALCEWMGWTKIEFYEDNAGPPFWSGVPPTKLNANWEAVDQYPEKLPDTNSLDVLHEMEMRMTIDQKERWISTFCRLCGIRFPEFPLTANHVFDCAAATAAQRREALLRTLILWED